MISLCNTKFQPRSDAPFSVAEYGLDDNQIADAARRRRIWEKDALQNEQDKGISVPGALKLDHLQPFKLILSQTFPTFSSFILGGQFLLPQRANTEEREFS